MLNYGNIHPSIISMDELNVTRVVIDDKDPVFPRVVLQGARLVTDYHGKNVA